MDNVIIDNEKIKILCAVDTAATTSLESVINILRGMFKTIDNRLREAMYDGGNVSLKEEREVYRFAITSVMALVTRMEEHVEHVRRGQYERIEELMPELVPMDYGIDVTVGHEGSITIELCNITPVTKH
jgi:hypothetical protein